MAQHHRHHLLSFILSLSLFTQSSAKVPAIIVFGDSTVDTGNNNHISTILQSDFPPYGRDFMGGRPTGRFCNGRLAVDFIAEALGLGMVVPAYLDPAYDIKDFATAVCFASAGTGIDNDTSNVLSVIPLWKEVQYFKDYKRRLSSYLGLEKAKETISEALYIVSIGTNDFLENYFLLVTGRFMQFTVEGFEDFLIARASKFITDIYLLGARKISFTSLTAIGCLPLERTINLMHGGACIEEYNKVARDFNAKLQAMVVDRCKLLPGLRLRYSDTYDLFHRIISNPSLYGFDNVHEGCCASGTFEIGYLCDQWNPLTCKDANKYFFWDAFHQTERVNNIMAQFTLNGSLAEFL